MRFHISDCDVCRTERDDGHKGGIATVKKYFPHIFADLPPVLSTEATGVPIKKKDLSP
jgi:hypothetical protein